MSKMYGVSGKEAVLSIISFSQPGGTEEQLDCCSLTANWPCNCQKLEFNSKISSI